jgi:hypothetical protein
MEACAEEPQNNTTYATKLAIKRLWNDPDNWVHGLGTATNQNKTRLKILPLITVHDSLNGQFRKEDTTWAVGKIKQWFNNPLQVAGQEIVIPFEGAYGTSWGNLKEGTI